MIIQNTEKSLYLYNNILMLIQKTIASGVRIINENKKNQPQNRYIKKARAYTSRADDFFIFIIFIIFIIFSSFRFFIFSSSRFFVFSFLQAHVLRRQIQASRQKRASQETQKQGQPAILPSFQTTLQREKRGQQEKQAL